MASTAKQSRPSVSVRSAICCAADRGDAADQVSNAGRPRREPACRARCKALQTTKAARNPPRRGRERSLSFAVRIVSGIQTCPRNASGVRRAVSRIAGLYPRGDSCRKSPDRERESREVARDDAVISTRAISAPRRAMSSTLMRPSAAENVRSASTSAGFTTSLTSAEAGSGGSSASSAVPAARRMSSALMRRVLARELVAAVRSAHAAQDAVAHQRLQHRFEMARRKLMARRQRLGRNRPAAGVDRHVDHGGNGENALAGHQRHGSAPSATNC